MNKLASRLGAKLCAFVLFAVLLTVFAASGVGIIYLIYTDAYIDNGKNLLSTQLESMARSKCYEAIDYYEQLVYEQNDYMIDTYRDKFSGDKSNFFFEITDEQGNQLLSNYFEENYSCKVQITNQFTLPDSKEHEETKNFDDYNTLREYLDALERSYILVSSSSIGSDDSKYILHVEYYENEQIKDICQWVCKVAAYCKGRFLPEHILAEKACLHKKYAYSNLYIQFYYGGGYVYFPYMRSGAPRG